MSNREKIFGEMDRELKQDFYEFQNFNDFLESHPTIVLDQIHNSYLKILGESNFDQNKLQYSELDFAVKRVMEESGRGVNIILEFLELKYQDKRKIVTLTFLKNLPFLGDFDKIHEFVQTLFQQEKGFFQIGVPTYGTLKINFDFTHENFLDSLELLKRNIESELLRITRKEKSV